MEAAPAKKVTAPIKVGARRIRPAQPITSGAKRTRPEDAAAGPAGALALPVPPLPSQAQAGSAGAAASREPSLRMSDFCTTYKKKRGAIPMTKPEKAPPGPRPAPPPRLRPQPPAAAAAAAAVVDRPTVEIIDGRIVVNQASLVIPVQPAVVEVIEEVYEDVGTIAAPSSYAGRGHKERWGLEETRRFYSAVQQCGTDFTLMQSLFPSRTQRQLKRKYKREERSQPRLIELALEPRMARPLDVVPFESSFGPLGIDPPIPTVTADDEADGDADGAAEPPGPSMEHLFAEEDDDDLVPL
ncbi:hypothetical protein M885DRAFT_518847 [Pelagophyceae sp. CCMP2097]|nr:hypothetical protein M885DRAFT_518847 [Pelagophyceae sp. CCMP2097]